MLPAADSADVQPMFGHLDDSETSAVVYENVSHKVGMIMSRSIPYYADFESEHIEALE